MYVQYRGKDNLPGCPSGGWIPLNDHCYLLSPNKMNWFQAKKFCEEKGGYLAEILSQSEQTNLEALLNVGPFKRYWIGLSDLADEGKFEWQHSLTPLGEYTNWIAGEPNDDGGEEDCVVIGADFNWRWNDLNYDANMNGNVHEIHALCQID